jgi:hypothetical protein
MSTFRTEQNICKKTLLFLASNQSFCFKIQKGGGGGGGTKALGLKMLC